MIKEITCINDKLAQSEQDKVNPLLADRLNKLALKLNDWDSNLKSLLSANPMIMPLVEKLMNFKHSKLSNLAELHIEYGYFCGSIDCISGENPFSSNTAYKTDFKIIKDIGRSLKIISEEILEFIAQDDKRIYREKLGIEALQRLLERNLNEHGSGSHAVKSVLVGLYNGDAYPVNLVNLRNLDSENFDDVISVLEMNARSCPSRSIENYFQNGTELWESMAKAVKRSKRAKQ